jgi:hypothetical protein
MRCVGCGTEMHLVQVVEDDTKMVTGYEHHRLECSGCREIEHRLVFNQSRKSRTRRNVQVVHDPSYEAAYSAKDTTSGTVVMRHRDRECLRELCEWIGWRVVDGAVSNADDKMGAEAVRA